jgi:rhodanese-related sulfurtransferase
VSLPKTFLQRMGQAVVQMAFLMFASTMVGVSVNAWRPNPLPLMADWSSAARLALPTGEQLAITLEEAQQAWFSAGAVFVDARPSEEFVLGHVEGARNLPWADFERNFAHILADVARGMLIITYCDGEGCGLSRELAVALRGRGYTNVRVLPNGWTSWQMARLPTEAGSDQHAVGHPSAFNPAPPTLDRQHEQ